MITAVRSLFDTVYDGSIGRLGLDGLWEKIDRSIKPGRLPLERRDISIAIGLGLIGMAVCIWAFTQTQRIDAINTHLSIFLQADIGRVADNMTSTGGAHARTSVHPIASILIYPFTAVLMAFGLGPIHAAATLVVLIMGVNVALFSLIIRLLGLPRPVGALFTVLFMASASFVFWSGIIELFPFAGFSLLLAMFMMFRIKTAHWAWWIVLNVLTLGLTTPNWVFGLIATAVRQKLKPFLVITAASLAVVGVLAVVQNATFAKAGLFFNPKLVAYEMNYIQPTMEDRGDYEQGWKPLSNLRSMYVTTVVAMPVDVEHQNGVELVTTNQSTGFPKGELAPVIAVSAWIVLFGLGIWGAFRRPELRLPLAGAGLMLLSQTALYSIYGEVTFLYSLHFMPLILLFASCAWFAPYKSVAVGLASVVIAFGAINNEQRLQETIETTNCLAGLESVQYWQSWDVLKSGVQRNANPDKPDFPPEDIAACKVT
ncbi:hypothetical protein WNY37_14375 [Henriciella sp. AS95]|uniref:hypothetical protein n=1 Tax=Henriciella sp. AS95 TaxID=3135782 RepID=UPI00317B16A0